MVADSNMTLTEHLEELRWCLLRALLSVFLISTLCYVFSAEIFAVMVAPLVAHLGPGESLIGTGVTEAFFIEIKVARLGGLALASPYIFLQIWRFIAPGLTGSEKKLVIPFVLCATLFFAAGSYFCYRIVLPVAFKYFIEQYQTMGAAPQSGSRSTLLFFSHGAGLWRDF